MLFQKPCESIFGNFHVYTTKWLQSHPGALKLNDVCAHMILSLSLVLSFLKKIHGWTTFGNVFGFFFSPPGEVKDFGNAGFSSRQQSSLQGARTDWHLKSLSDTSCWQCTFAHTHRRSLNLPLPWTSLQGASILLIHSTPSTLKNLCMWQLPELSQKPRAVFLLLINPVKVSVFTMKIFEHGHIVNKYCIQLWIWVFLYEICGVISARAQVVCLREFHLDCLGKTETEGKWRDLMLKYGQMCSEDTANLNTWSVSN